MEYELIISLCIFDQVKKPLRSMHCHTCSACIARYDQHCIWTGCCIGEFILAELECCLFVMPGMFWKLEKGALNRLCREFK